MIQSYLSQVNTTHVIKFVFYMLILYVTLFYMLKIILNLKYSNNFNGAMQKKQLMCIIILIVLITIINNIA